MSRCCDNYCAPRLTRGRRWGRGLSAHEDCASSPFSRRQAAGTAAGPRPRNPRALAGGPRPRRQRALGTGADRVPVFPARTTARPAPVAARGVISRARQHVSPRRPHERRPRRRHDSWRAGGAGGHCERCCGWLGADSYWVSRVAGFGKPESQTNGPRAAALAVLVLVAGVTGHRATACVAAHGGRAGAQALTGWAAPART